MNHWLRPKLEKSLHDELHREVPFIPTLGTYTIALVRRDFIPIKNDYAASTAALIETINESRCDRTTPFEIEASQLTIKALALQLPYLEEAIYE